MSQQHIDLAIQNINSIFRECGMTAVKYKKLLALKFPFENKYKDMQPEEIIALADVLLLVRIDRLWTERNRLDTDRELIAINARVISFSNIHLGKILRWHFAGLDIELAVRKVRTMVVHQEHINLSLIKKKKAKIDRKKPYRRPIIFNKRSRQIVKPTKKL